MALAALTPGRLRRARTPPLYAHAAGEVSDATLGDFRARLFRMETDGCLILGGAQRGAAAPADLLALPSSSLDIEPGRKT